MNRKETKKIPINPANGMTFLRIIGSFCLLFIPACSTMFLAIYTLAGVTDVLDGWLARKTGTASAWGARLDSIADLCFYAVLFLKIFPILKLPVGIWYAVIVVLLLRVTGYMVAVFRYHQFAAVHTWLNKLTGLAVFAIPYVAFLPIVVPFCGIVCVIAIAAASEELLLHFCRREYHPDTRTILGKKKLCARFGQKSSINNNQSVSEAGREKEQ